MASNKTATVKVTNISRRPTFVHTTGGQKMLDPRASVEAEFEVGQIQAMRSNGMLDVSEDPAAKPDADAAKAAALAAEKEAADKAEAEKAAAEAAAKAKTDKVAADAKA